MTAADPSAGAWAQDVPALAGLEPETKAALAAAAQRLAIPAGSILFRPGDPCRSYLFLLAGTVRVQMLAENGREIVLYRVGPGQACVVTTACLMAHVAYAVEGWAETDLDAIGLPAAVFDALLARSPAFRELVFGSFGARIADLLLVIEEIAFQRVDRRLARFLVEAGGGERRLALTHQALAVELGTAREVVSRQLKELERLGWIALGRGAIEIVDPARLAAFAASAADHTSVTKSLTGETDSG